MPFSQKPIVTVICSYSLSSIDFSVFINPDHCGAIITFTVNAYLGYNTKYQKAPVIVIRALGGMS